MSIYKRTSGRYAVLIDLEPTATGLRRRKSVGTYRTRKEAESAERKALERRERGEDVAAGTINVADLIERFIESRRTKEPPCALRTVQRYEELARLTINPHIGSVSVAKLKAAQVDSWLGLLKQKGSVKGKPLSARSQMQSFAVLRAALRWAVKKGYAWRAVTEAADAPKIRPSHARAINENEAARFLAVADSTRWGPFMRLALGTGARRGELLALRWEDVCVPEVGRATVTIRRAFVENKGDGERIVEKGTKNESIRTIALGTLAIEALRQQWDAQAREREESPDLYADSGHVFQGELGGPIPPFMATNAFRGLRAKANVAATLHDLRHTAASWMLAAGVDIASVSRTLGHTKVTTTLGIYAHPMEDAQSEALATIDARLERATNAKERAAG